MLTSEEQEIYDKWRLKNKSNPKKCLNCKVNFCQLTFCQECIGKLDVIERITIYNKSKNEKNK